MTLNTRQDEMLRTICAGSRRADFDLRTLGALRRRHLVSVLASPVRHGLGLFLYYPTPTGEAMYGRPDKMAEDRAEAAARRQMGWRAR